MDIQHLSQINSRQFSSRMFPVIYVRQQKELLYNLQAIESSILLGDQGQGIVIVRELIEQLNNGEKECGILNLFNNTKSLYKLEMGRKVQPIAKYIVRIYTLGRFSMVVDGIPVVFKAKAQKRPMDLLKTLIALGGRGISKSQLADLLWPDSAGDASISVINTTLSRLRKLIGKEAIQTDNGCLSLNPMYCWVDCWEFERLLNTGKNQKGLTSEAVMKIFDLYQGPFLAGEEHGWLVARREKLRNKLLHVSSKYATTMMGHQQFKLAGYVLSKCIEIDDLNEDFYVDLMRCQIQLNKPSAASLTYRRCYKSITTLLGTLPSEACQKLYSSLHKERINQDM